jgi:hypothetical protein
VLEKTEKELKVTLDATLSSASASEQRQAKDEIKFMVLKSEINHWERKCSSLSKEVERLLRYIDGDHFNSIASTDGPIKVTSILIIKLIYI